MRKSKYETHVLPNLERIAKWAEAGADDREIAAKLGISPAGFRSYLEKGEKGDARYRALTEVFRQAREVPDDQVEAALYKRSCGYSYTEVTVEEKLDKEGNIYTLTKTVQKNVPPDSTSAMFYLTNRRPARWQYKPEKRKETEDGAGGVVVLPEVIDEGRKSGQGATGAEHDSLGGMER